jgi:WD40 repeat protein
MYVYLVVYNLEHNLVLRNNRLGEFNIANNLGRLTVVDVLEELSNGGLGSGLSLLSSLVNLNLNLLVDSLKLGSGSEASLKDTVTAVVNAITLSTDGSNLFTSAVRKAGVRHGVTVVAVGRTLDEDRTVAIADIVSSETETLLGSKNIHAINPESRDIVTTSVELSGSSVASSRSTHGEIIVLAEEDDRELPHGGHVSNLEDLALVGSTITIGGDSDATVVVVHVGEGKTSTEGNLGADDTVTTVEVVLLVVHVHGATLAAGAAGDATHELGEHGLDRIAARDLVTVITVSGDHGISFLKVVLHTNNDSFLTIVEMAETANKTLLIHSIGDDLNTTVKAHLLIESKYLILSGGDGALRHRLETVNLERAVNLESSGGHETLHGAKCFNGAKKSVKASHNMTPTIGKERIIMRIHQTNGSKQS